MAGRNKLHLYLVVNEVRADAPRNKRTSKKDIGRLHFLWTDSDAKDAPGDTPEKRKANRLAQLEQEFDKYPSSSPRDRRFAAADLIRTGRSSRSRTRREPGAGRRHRRSARADVRRRRRV